MNLQDLIYAGLNRNTNAFVFARDLEHQDVLFTNPNYEAIYERPVDAYLEDPEEFINYVHEEDKEAVIKNHRAFIEERISKDEEYRILTPEGKIKWIWSRVFYMESSGLGNSVIIGIVEDITRRQEAANELCDMSELAHDLKSPFNSILGLNKLLEVELAGNQHVKSYFEHIEKSCKYGLKVIEEALTYAQVKTKESLHCHIFNLKTFADEVMELHKLDADKLKVSLELFYNAEDDLEITGDKVLLQRGISNLISNALKFTPNGGYVNIHIWVIDQNVHIKVEDNGIGIPDEMGNYLFDKFSHAKRIGLHGEKPDGVGLYNVKNIVTLHGGEVSFQSKENEGTTFDIVIPFIPGLCMTPW